MNTIASTLLHAADTQSASQPLTIAEAQRILATWTDLAPRRAQKMRTALSTAARTLAPQEPPKRAGAAVHMDCATLSKLLKAPAATFGMSDGRRMSLCSELRYILRRLGQHEPESRGTGFSSTALQACAEALPYYRRLAILDFLRFLDAKGITPEVVDAGTFVAYLTHCAERTLCADPAKRTRQVLATWNWARHHAPGWPGKLVAPPERADRYSLPLESYPASFQQDLERYAERLGGQDVEHIFSEQVFHDDGARPRRAQRALRPSSINSRRWIIRCAAAALVIKGVDQARILSLRDLVDPLGHPEKIIRFFMERRAGRKSSIADRVAQTLHLLARDYCGVPEAHAAQIADWARRVKMPEPNGLTEKNTRRLRALMQPRVRAMLLWFPRELMRQASVPGLQPRAAARLAMYAVAMEVLLVCPMRRGNLAALRLDRHLHQPDPRRRGFTHIVLNATEVKNDRGVHWPIPLESRELLDIYLTQHRPHLVMPGNPYLFGADSKQRSSQHLGEWLSREVTKRIGVEFNVHLARHFAAWNFLRVNPGQYEVVRQVLGHRTIAVTIRHYVGLEADSAAEQFDRTVLRDRQASRAIATQAFRQGTGGFLGRGRGVRR